jgi:hypothetical protein
VIENKICEYTDHLTATLSSGITSLQVMVTCKRCELGEQWNSSIAVSCTLTKHSDIRTENRSFDTLWLSPLTIISIDITNISLLPLLFLWSLSILAGCPVINTCSCHQDLKLFWMGPMAYDYILAFMIQNLWHICFMIMEVFSNISGMYLWLGYREVFKWLRF